MTTLLIDALIALVKTIDRGMSAVENRVSSPVNSPLTVERDAQPAAGGDSSSGVSATTGGGHPRNTSDLLREASILLENAFCLIQAMEQAGARIPSWAVEIPAATAAIAPELRDHAAQLAVHGL